MKKFLFVILILFMANNSYAYSFNKGIYNAISASSYRNNYYRQTMNPRVVPYWQAQSNYSTRNRMYKNYPTYSRYMNSINQYNYNAGMVRRYR